MHMADALISPAVGGTFWAASAALVGYTARKMRRDFDSSLVPLMGVLGAFVFAAQMINFTIPGTGSSGHLGGAMLLAAILGPYAAFLTVSSVLMVQALFFADGGLLALGCNMFNLGFLPCFVAYPLLFKPLTGSHPSRRSLMTASIVAAVLGLQMGAFSVVLQTTVSGISALPFSTFVWLMQPIHLGIGLVEGIVTALVVAFVYEARPEILSAAAPRSSWSVKKLATAFALMAVITGGMLSWFASAHPDGLEWSIAATSGKEELETPEQGIYASLAALQSKLSFMPDYAFKQEEKAHNEKSKTDEAAWPAVDSGTSTAGIVGGALTLLLAALLGFMLRRRPV